MLVFVIERMEETRANKGRQTAGPTGKVQNNLRPGGGEDQKTTVDRESGNRKVERKQEDHEKRKEKWESATKKIQNHLCSRFGQLHGEKKSELLKLKRVFDTKKKQEVSRAIKKQFNTVQGKVFANLSEMLKRDAENEQPGYKNPGLRG